MKQQIWKFEIGAAPCAVEMPKGAQILTVQNQNDLVCIWALVNPGNAKELRYFEIYGTGHNIFTKNNTELRYINTYQLDEGTIVFHLFERVHNN